MHHDARPFIYIVVAWSDVLRRDTVKVFPALLANDITPKISVLTRKSVTFFQFLFSSLTASRRQLASLSLNPEQSQLKDRRLACLSL